MQGRTVFVPILNPLQQGKVLLQVLHVSVAGCWVWSSGMTLQESSMM